MRKTPNLLRSERVYGDDGMNYRDFIPSPIVEALEKLYKEGELEEKAFRGRIKAVIKAFIVEKGAMSEEEMKQVAW